MGSGNSPQPPLIPDMHLLRAADTLAPYIGLVREAIELGAQLEREETQRLAIRSDYELRMKELDASIDTLRTKNGFVLFCQENDEYPNAQLCPKTTVTQAQIDQLKGQLAGLSEDLALVPGALGLK